MTKTWMLLSVIAAIVLAGCGVETVDPWEKDWCYLFNFTANPQGFGINVGTWTTQGIGTDINGDMEAFYDYDRDVYPDIIVVRVARPTGVTGVITATAVGTVFGVSTSFTAPMPADLDIADLRFVPDTTGVDYIGDHSAITIAIDADQPVMIESLFVAGTGASPFPTNLCAEPTPTPITEDTGTGTAAPSTPSPSPTVTGTLSATPEPEEWECIYDFTESAEGWVTTGDFPGTTRDSAGFHSYVNEDDVEGLHIEIYLPATITTTEILFEYTYGGAGAEYGSGFTTNTGIIYFTFASAVFPQPYLDEVTRSFNYVGILLVGEATVERVTMNGTGLSPCDPTPTPTPTNTPGATNTPGPTNTSEPLWTSCIDFTTNQFYWEGIDANYEEGIGWVQDAGEWSVGRAGIGPTAKKKIKFIFSGPWAGSIRARWPVGPTTTGWKLGAGSQVIIDLTGESWIPTQNVYFDFDGNFGPYALEKICWMDPFPSTGTPIPGMGSRTPIPTMTGTVGPSRTPVLVPNPPIYITSTAGVFITTTPLYSGTGVYNPTGTTSPLITGTPGGEGTPSGEGDGTGFGGGGGGFGDVGDILGFGWNIGWGLFGALVAYLGQAGSIVTALITAFANATPQPIPGLPQCITNPMASDLCAIYYVADYTIFAQGTPGAIIIPLLIIIMNIWIAVYFVRWVLRIIRRGEGVTDVL